MSDVPIKPRRATAPFMFAALIMAIAATVIPLALYGPEEAGLRSAIRATARVGAVLITVTFMISSLHVLARAEWSKWLLLHRREIGLGFAIVQFVHLGIVIALAVRYTESFFATTDMTGIVGGGIGYVWLTAMVVTSFDGPRKRIGPRGWRWLHTSGIYVLWGIFVFTYLGHTLIQPLYAIFLTPLLVAFALRVAARIVKKSSSRRAALS